MASVATKWISRLLPSSGGNSTWVLYFSQGMATGLKGCWNGEAKKIVLSSKFHFPCPLGDGSSAKKALYDNGMKKGDACYLLAAPEECSLALIDDLNAPDNEAAEALRWKMADRVDFDITQAVIEAQRVPGAEEGGLQRASWWAVAMSEIAMRKHLSALESCGFRCRVVDALPFAQSNLAALGWEGVQKARAVICVGKEFGTLTFSSGGSLLFHKQLDWNQSALALGDVALWERLELELLRNLDYFDRRLSAIATGELCFIGSQAEEWASQMKARLSVPTSSYDWSAGYIDECGALAADSVGTYAWCAGALLRLSEEGL